jgi:ubiquinone/menaquinone biosynthesis C-methylase UbiE
VKSRHTDQPTSIQVPAAHYFRAQYDQRSRFLSYWHQIDAIWSLQPQNVLEIGVGNSLVAGYLKRRGINIVTLDIDASLCPDSVGSVLQIPFPDGAFAAVACFEVLEHLPYQVFPVALGELYRVSSEYVIISVPDHTRAYRFNIQIPKLGEIRKLIVIPKLNPPRHTFNGQHYWEIGKAEYPLRRIMRDMEEMGFDILGSYRIFESPKYHFFILRKRHGAKEE